MSRELTFERFDRGGRSLGRGGKGRDLLTKVVEFRDMLGGKSPIGRLELLAALLVPSELLHYKVRRRVSGGKRRARRGEHTSFIRRSIFSVPLTYCTALR